MAEIFASKTEERQKQSKRRLMPLESVGVLITNIKMTFSRFMNKDFTEMGYMTELLLYAAARAQLVKENIKPALSAGKAVIADRFVDSSAVYQGIGRGLGIDTVYKVNEFALQGILPDMTFLMDLDAEVGIARKKNQAELDRMEQESLDFHKKVKE